MKWRKFLFLFYFLLGYLLQPLITKLLSTRHENDKLESHQFFVIFVISGVGNHDRRKAIRDTWAKELDSEVNLYFVLNAGLLSSNQRNDVHKEQEEFGDMLVFHEIEDSFQSLTTTVLATMLWVTGQNSVLGAVSNNTNIVRPFTKFSYFLKCDDDSYVRVSELYRELRGELSKSDKLYWGFFDGRAPVKRTGKYKELSWNICNTYLPYALGGGYILSEKTIHFITDNAHNLKRYQNEDVSVGAWLANLDGLVRKHDPRFDTEYLSRGCHQSYLVTHKKSPADMYEINRRLSDTGRLCAREYRTRLSYNYDWNALPSKCCTRNNPETP